MSDSFDEQPVFKARDRTSLRTKRGQRAVAHDYEYLPSIGDVIKDRYMIEEVIGKGQFGWVFLVRHVWLGQLFAMKVMHPRVAGDAQWVDRFREEARQTSALGHDHIVFVTDFDCAPNVGYFFVMEYLDGVTLSSLIKHRSQLMDPERAIKIVLQACDALSAMHEVGVVHRDLKPSNIMVCQKDGEDFIKLLDFGISSTVFEVSETRKLYGTPAYMGPEQTRRMTEDGRSDQFALATILYQMFVGERPWKIKKWSDASYKAREGVQFQPVSERRNHPMLTRELDAVLSRALELDPEDRWEDMKEFAYALSMATGVSSEAWCLGSSGGVGASENDDEEQGLGDVPSFVTLLEQDSCAHDSDGLSSMQEGRLDYRERLTSSLQGRALVSMTFRTNERFLREWSRADGLKLGRVDLRTPRLYGMGEAIDVRVVVEEEGLVMVLKGEVLSVYECEPEKRSASEEYEQEPITRLVRHGAVVRFLPESQDRLKSLANALIRELSGELLEQSIVKLKRAMEPSDWLSTGEAFLISRLSEPMNVRDLRRLFSGLSFELDEVLLGLVHRGFVQVNHDMLSDIYTSEASMSQEFLSMEIEEHELSSMSGVEESLRVSGLTVTGESNALRTSGGYYMYNQEQVEHVLELVAFFKRTHNDEAAIETLQRAIEGSPAEGEFYHQLALLYARGDYAPRRAMRAIDTALELAPKNEGYAHSREYIRTLYRRYKKVANG